MRFWDTSAVVAFFFRPERSSTVARRLMRDGSGIAVWALTRTEFVSALERRRREGLPIHEVMSIRDDFEKLARRWREVEDLHLVRSAAERFLHTHSLAAATLFSSELPGCSSVVRRSAGNS